MTRLAPTLVIVVAASAGLVAPREAEACSCVGPRSRILSPSQADDVPLNARVRLEVPNGARRSRPALRVHETGAEVTTTSRSFPNGSVTTFELVPTAPLTADTRYEVAVIDDSTHPSTLVVGAFRSGTAVDTTAPKLEKVGIAAAYKNTAHGGGSCQIAGPWVVVEGLAASDPSRPAAQLSWAVWRGDAAGNVDTSKPPALIVPAQGASLQLGRASMCDPHDFALPLAGTLTIAIAAVDEAGNASAPRKLSVAMGSAQPPKRSP